MPKSLLTAILALFAILSALGAASAVGTPSPAAFDQWQPQREPPERRLSAVVSAWEAQTAVSDLLARLSQASGVALAASDDVASMQVTIYTRDRVLSGLMVDLAQLTDGAWYYRRDELPERREYVLSARAGSLDIGGQWVRERESAQASAWNAQRRAARTDRIEAYRKALTLSEAQALALYEASDPWLCATLLDPTLRPMVAYVCGLSNGDRDQLLGQGVFEQRVSALPPDFARHLADWASGKWGLGMGRRESDPRPDRLDRFASPEERWANSTVRLEWTDTSLLLVLRVADGGWFFTDCLALANHTPIMYREKLVALGLHQATPEYDDAITREAKAWDEKTGPGATGPGPDVGPDPYLPLPDHDSSYAKQRTDLSSLQGHMVPAAQLLEAAATQVGIDVLSDFVPDRRLSLEVTPEEAPASDLGHWLDRIRTGESGGFTWRLRGRYMVCWDLNARLEGMSLLPADAVLVWQSLVRPGASVLLDDLASALARLTELQTSSLEGRFPSLAGLRQRLDRLRLYGRLTDAQRGRLADGLPFPELAPDQREMVFEAAREGRAWVQSGDLTNCVLRLLPRRLASGAEGVSLVAEYHFADSPGDRDVLFTSPLLIEIPQDSAAQSHGKGSTRH